MLNNKPKLSADSSIEERLAKLKEKRDMVQVAEEKDSITSPLKTPFFDQEESIVEPKKFTIPTPSKKPVIRFNLERTPVVKVGFDLPEDADYDIEIIATKERKTKKDLLTEIVADWLKKNKHKKD